MQKKEIDLNFVDEIFQNEKGLDDYFRGVQGKEVSFHVSNSQTTLAFFLKSAALEFPPAMVEIWLYYSSPLLHNHPSPEELHWKSEVEKREQWFHDAVKKTFKNPRLQVTIGRAFADGVLPPQHDIGIVLIEEALKVDYPLAQVAYGLLIERGKGLSVNREKSRRFFELAALKGHAGAQFKYANYLNTGDGGPQDKTLAEFWYHQSAEQRFVWGEISYGAILIRKGKIEEGTEYLERGAAQGYAIGQHNAGAFTTNRKRALEWWELAANQGFENSQLNLGRAYSGELEGYTEPEFEKDLDKAEFWFEKATKSESNLRLWIEFLIKFRGPTEALSKILARKTNLENNLLNFCILVPSSLFDLQLLLLQFKCFQLVEVDTHTDSICSMMNYRELTQCAIQFPMPEFKNCVADSVKTVAADLLPLLYKSKFGCAVAFFYSEYQKDPVLHHLLCKSSSECPHFSTVQRQLRGYRNLKPENTVFGSYQRWDLLPNDILREIFRFLGPTALARVLKVSQKWREIGKSLVQNFVEKNWVFLVENYQVEIDPALGLDLKTLGKIAEKKRIIRKQHSSAAVRRLWKESVFLELLRANYDKEFVTELEFLEKLPVYNPLSHQLRTKTGGSTKNFIWSNTS